MAIGNLIVVDQAPIGSSYNKFKVYSSETKSGSFSVINGSTGQVVTSPSFFDVSGTSTTWYKTSYFNSSDETETDQSDAFQPQNEIYTTVRKVERFMRLPTITDTTTPSIQDVTRIIKETQDRIDYKTGHAWRKRYSGTKTGDLQTARYEYYDLDYLYEYHTGRPVYLKHRFVYTFDTDEGDVAEVWNGNEWENWLTARTEGRGEDFWVDYDEGTFFMNARWGITRPKGIRFKYRYGEREVNEIVQNICTKMVAIELKYGESRNAFIPEGQPGALVSDNKLTKWERDIETDLSGLKEFQVLSSWR